MPKIFFSTTFRSDEIEALKATRPQTLLLSFALWKNKPIKKLIDALGYRPECILLDPGAVTFKKTGVNTGIYDIYDMYNGEYSEEEAAEDILNWILDDELMARWSIPFYDYLRYIYDNKEYIDLILAFDDMDTFFPTEYIHRLMTAMGLEVVPVFHYVDEKYRSADYFDRLDRYVQAGSEMIALGGILKTTKHHKRRDFAKECIERYPNQKFHLLGTQRRSIFLPIPQLYSCDGNAWKLTAGHKKNRKPGQSKVERSIELIRQLQEAGS